MNLDFLKNKIVISVIVAIVVVIGVYISNKNNEDEENSKSSGYYVMVLIVSFGVIYGVIYLYDMYFAGDSKSFLKGGSKNTKIENNSDTIFCDNPSW